MSVSAVQEIAQVYKQASMQPWESGFETIRVAPNCWYIGGSWVSVTVIATSAGLAIIDAGLRGQTFLLFEAIRKLGYDPQRDIKLCLLTHAHLDHCSGMANFQNYAHPVMYMSPYEKDWPAHPEKYYQDVSEDIDQFVPYKVDRLYDYKTPIVLGDHSFRVLHTPGHTVGCSSIFFEDVDETTGKAYNVGLHGGLGLDGLRDILHNDSGEAATVRENFRAQLVALRDIPVDICIANHPQYIDMESVLTEDHTDYTPFVDPTAWKAQLDRKIAELDAIERGRFS